MKPCPFCGCKPSASLRGPGEMASNPKARCLTDECWGSRLPAVLLEVPEQVNAWNSRANFEENNMQHVNHSIAAMHSYRAFLMPGNVACQDVEDLADAGKLPTIRLRSPCAEVAATQAAHVSGKAVLRVERVEG